MYDLYNIIFDMPLSDRLDMILQLKQWPGVFALTRNAFELAQSGGKALLAMA